MILKSRTFVCSICFSYVQDTRLLKNDDTQKSIILKNIQIGDDDNFLFFLLFS